MCGAHSIPRFRICPLFPSKHYTVAACRTEENVFLPISVRFCRHSSSSVSNVWSIITWSSPAPGTTVRFRTSTGKQLFSFLQNAWLVTEWKIVLLQFKCPISSNLSVSQTASLEERIGDDCPVQTNEYQWINGPEFERGCCWGWTGEMLFHWIVPGEMWLLRVIDGDKWFDW